MPASSKATVYMSGKVYWPKILGTPRPNYGGDAREWTMEFEPDENGLKLLKEHKLTDRLRDKYEDRGKYLTLRKSELNKDGNPNPPIRVYTDDNQEWDKNTLIGNGTQVDVKLDIRDYGPGKKKGVYPLAVRVKELVPYVSNEFGGMDADPVAPAKDRKESFKKDFGLEDDLNDPLPE